MDFRQARGPGARRAFLPRNRKIAGRLKQPRGFGGEGMGTGEMRGDIV